MSLDAPGNCGWEPQVEEQICFVEDEHADLREVARPPRHEVEQATGRCDDDVRAAAQRELLIAIPDAAVERDDPRRAMASERLELGGDLRAELPRRDDHEGERRRGAALDPLEDRERESAGLAGAGLRLREEIPPGTKVRDGKVLDRREARPTEVTRRTIEVWSKRDQVSDVLPMGPTQQRSLLQKKRAAPSGPAHVS